MHAFTICMQVDWGESTKQAMKLEERLEMLPKIIYEALPAMYFLLGIVCAFALESGVALISSGLLITVSVFVYLMRRLYRNNNKVERELL